MTTSTDPTPGAAGARCAEEGGGDAPDARARLSGAARPSECGTGHAGLDPVIVGVIEFFESISPESVARIAELYSADAWFKDPFNEVRGTAAIEAIFAAMFSQVDQPRFRVRQVIGDSKRACLLWDFEFHLRRFDRSRLQCIRGASWLEFDAQGRIACHRDYWDAAEELYEKLPLVGALMRWLKRRAAH